MADDWLGEAEPWSARRPRRDITTAGNPEKAALRRRDAGPPTFTGQARAPHASVPLGPSGVLWVWVGFDRHQPLNFPEIGWEDADHVLMVVATIAPKHGPWTMSIVCCAVAPTR